MNWTIIGLLVVFILVLLCLLSVAIYTIRRLHKHTRKIEEYLDKYKVLSTRLTNQLTRINEIVEEADGFLAFSFHIYDDTKEVFYKIKSLVKVVADGR